MSFADSLSALAGSTAFVYASLLEPAPDSSSIDLVLSSGARLRADYWRLVQDGREKVSSFDYEQQYGLPAAIDAIRVLAELITGKILVSARLEKTGDILLAFSGHLTLIVFSFTGYEIWEFAFPDGSVEYSNYNK